MFGRAKNTVGIMKKPIISNSAHTNMSTSKNFKYFFIVKINIVVFLDFSQLCMS